MPWRPRGEAIRLSLHASDKIKRRMITDYNVITVGYVEHALRDDTLIVGLSRGRETTSLLASQAGLRWRSRLAQWHVHWSQATSTSVSNWMGDRQRRPSVVNWTCVRLSVWTLICGRPSILYIAVIVLTPGDVISIKQASKAFDDEQYGSTVIVCMAWC